MSRNSEMRIISDKGFPRVSGDEPGSERLTYRRTGFSPRERG